MDFFTFSTIQYALTVSPTTYASYIVQFRVTVKSEIVNDVKQMDAKVDGKTVVISKSSVRSDLHFNDEDSIACLLNDEIFENLALMGYARVSTKLTFQKAFFAHQWKVVRAATTAASLEAEQESGNINKSQLTTTINEPSPQGTSSGSRPRRHVTILGDTDDQTRFETASKQSHDLPLLEVNTSGSGEDNMEQQDDLTDFIPPTPHDSPLLGGHIPGSDEGRPNINELMNICNKLSNRDLALEQFKTAQDLIGTSKKKTLDKENVYKKGRDESKRTKELNLSDKGSGETKVFDYTTLAEKDVNADEPVSTAGDVVNAASVNPNASVVGPSTSAVGPSTSIAEDIFEDEMTTMADTLMAIRKTRPRTTSLVIHDDEEEPRRATPPPIVQSQDKERLQHEEREQFTVDEKGRMLVDLIAERKRFFATQRAEQIRNKPPTKAQLKNKMVTYLKHMGKYTHNQLTRKRFKEIQILYEREQKWINNFVPIDSEEVNDSKQQAESSKKRSRVDHDKESVKKQKLKEDDAEKEELRACLDIVLVDDIAINVESLATKYPIVDWKTHTLTKHMMRMGVALDEEHLLFIAGEQDNVVDEDVDEQPVQDLALNVDNVFQPDNCDAFDSDVDDAPTAQTMFMANLSSAYLVYDEAGSSYDSDILSEAHDHDHYQDVVCEHHEVHEMHDNVKPNYVVDSHADYMSDSNMIPYD
nr:retrovirus-related Pol polyprotein from transposon TNT 1-94 [Tanacetum cinerariifolium]